MAGPRNGILHKYTNTLSAFEHIPNSSAASAQNLIIFIGGLFDGIGTIPYVKSISDSLSSSWSLAEVILSSSYKGWGISSLQEDVKELAKCVEYFSSIKEGLIVLMGHSTGCQDVMAYLTSPDYDVRPPIDGGILQAPVSDREALCMNLDPIVYSQACLDAQEMIDADNGDKILSTCEDIREFFPCPITAYRWLSLASPNKDGDDDYFSSDLTLAQLKDTFGNLPVGSPLCILISGADEYMPDSIDKESLYNRWVNVIEEGHGNCDLENSGIIEDATHSLCENDLKVVDNLVKRVVGFLDSTC